MSMLISVIVVAYMFLYWTIWLSTCSATIRETRMCVAGSTRLSGSALLSAPATSALMCAITCVQHQSCRSVNWYAQRRNCELNAQMKIEMENSSATQDAACMYWGEDACQVRHCICWSNSLSQIDFTFDFTFRPR